MTCFFTASLKICIFGNIIICTFYLHCFVALLLSPNLLHCFLSLITQSSLAHLIPAARINKEQHRINRSLQSTENIRIMGDIVQEIFNVISLERDPKIWQSYRQDVAMTEKRINFLAEFEQTLFSKVLKHYFCTVLYKICIF